MKGISLGILSRVEKFKASIVLSALLILFYFLFSNGNLFIEKQALLLVSFTLGRPFNIIPYMFAHMSLWHLAVNLLTLLLFAAIVETRLSSLDTVLIFILSGTVTAAIFSFFNPGIGLVGASAGASGIMAAGFVLNFRKAAVFVLVAIALFAMAFFSVMAIVEWQEQSLEEKSMVLERQFNEAVETGQTEKAVEIASEKRVVKEKIESFSESKRFASAVEVDPFIHGYAAIAGILYLFAFRAKKTKKAVKEQNILGFLKGRKP